MVQTPEGRGERRRVDPKEKRTVKRVSNVRAPKTNFNICFGDCVTHTHTYYYLRVLLLLGS